MDGLGAMKVRTNMAAAIALGLGSWNIELKRHGHGSGFAVTPCDISLRENVWL